MMQNLYKIGQQLWNPLGLEFADGQADSESKEYDGCTFTLDKFRILYRKAKITPKKTGQFVTLWRRGQDGVSEPFGVEDDFDCCIIAVEQNEKFGIFVFPKNVLSRHGILSGERKPGKRGFRIYSDFDVTLNKQAQSTRNWQKVFFINFENPNYAQEKFTTIFNRLDDSL